MKIKEEDFNKLNQNDRIEYLLRLEHFEKNKLSSGAIFFCYAIILPFLLTTIIISSISTNYQLINLLFRTLMIFFDVLIFLVIIEIVCYFVNKEKWEKIQKRFFNFKIELNKAKAGG